jgi:hypothetical protein
VQLSERNVEFPVKKINSFSFSVARNKLLYFQKNVRFLKNCGFLDKCFALILDIFTKYCVRFKKCNASAPREGLLLVMGHC